MLKAWMRLFLLTDSSVLWCVVTHLGPVCGVMAGVAQAVQPRERSLSLSWQLCSQLWGSRRVFT